jgi:branched-subunit amino acid transport protein
MDLWLLLTVCGLATYLWRGPGVLIASEIDARGALFTWVSCVAYAIIAGVVSRMLVMPTGALAAYFWLTRRNLFVGVAAGAAALWLLRV